MDFLHNYGVKCIHIILFRCLYEADCTQIFCIVIHVAYAMPAVLDVMLSAIALASISFVLDVMLSAIALASISFVLDVMLSAIALASISFVLDVMLSAIALASISFELEVIHARVYRLKYPE
jgi:hypothetical protein